jgi:hypothetical protein
METIFVQIASYRDSELIPTVLDCISKAKHPQRIYLGICAQYDPIKDELEDLLFIHPNIKVKMIHYKNSKGACWARNIAQSLYGNETFSYQIDSHMRFIKDWDEHIIELWKTVKDDKAIFTGYPGKYDPNTPDSEWELGNPTICGVKRILNNKFKQRGEYFEPTLNRPLRGVTISAANTFGPGSIITDVPYDPYLYFDGEEMTMALRYFTHGYNIYHPHKVVSYHYWTRESSPRHWSEHKDWGTYENISKERIASLIGNGDTDLGEYGLGTVRTLKEYEQYAGIDFGKNLVHIFRVDAVEPPTDYSEEGWDYVKYMKKIEINLQWNIDNLSKDTDINYWYLRIYDQDDYALHSFHITKEEHQNIIKLKRKKIYVEFEYNSKISEVKYFTINQYNFKTNSWYGDKKFNINQTN